MNAKEIELKYGPILPSKPERVGINHEVVGCIPYSLGRKRYVLKCLVCVTDTELHGEGLFVAPAVTKKKGVVVCGCHKQYKV